MVIWYYIGPRDMIIGCVFRRHHDWMRHHFVREINLSCVLDEGKTDFAAARVSSEGDIIFKIMDVFLCAVVHFLSPSNEVQVHCVDKSLSTPRAARLPEATEEPKSQRIW